VTFNNYLLPKLASKNFVQLIKSRRKSLSHALFVLTAKCLSTLTGAEHPCFGNVLSGREMNGVEKAVNNFADMYFIPIFDINKKPFIELVDQTAHTITSVNLYQHHNHRAHIPEGYSPGNTTSVKERSSAFAFGMEVNNFDNLEKIEKSGEGKMYASIVEMDIPFDWLGIRFYENSGYLTCSININNFHFGPSMSDKIYNLLSIHLVAIARELAVKDVIVN
jgi:hypothetical protein